MAEEDVSDIGNITALFCFDIRGFEKKISSVKCFNSDNVKEGWNKPYLPSQIEGHWVSLLPEINTQQNKTVPGWGDDALAVHEQQGLDPSIP